MLRATGAEATEMVLARTAQDLLALFVPAYSIDMDALCAKVASSNHEPKFKIYSRNHL